MDSSGDHVSLANLLRDFRTIDKSEVDRFFVDRAKIRAVFELRRHVLHELGKRDTGKAMEGFDESSDERSVEILKCVLSGFLFSIARLMADGRYYSIRNSQKQLPNWNRNAA